MFELTVISDSHVRIVPENLAKPRVEAISDAIEAIYVDKVMPNLGLCITLHEILTIEGGTIYPTDGAATFSVKFSVIFFRPFVGEVLVGKLVSCDKGGLKLSLGFFDDIRVPEHLLQQPSTFDLEEKVWVWTVDGNEAFMDIGEQIRFRVESVQYPEESSLPAVPDAAGGEAAPADSAAAPTEKIFAPMVVQGDINADGLGCVSWW